MNFFTLAPLRDGPEKNRDENKTSQWAELQVMLIGICFVWRDN